LVESGQDRHGHWQPSRTFLDHFLAIADLFVSVMAASNAGQLQLVRYETEPKTWRTIPGYGMSDTLRPDLLLVLGHGELEYHWRIEVDLASEHAATIQRKCQQYLRYWQSGAAGDSSEVFPRVAWLTTSVARAERIREVAEQVQGDVPLFEVGLLKRPLEVMLPDRGSP
jgi:Replication-relaxation